MLRECLDSLRQAAADTPDLRVFVVDNASSDGPAEMVRRSYPDVAFVANEVNRGFAAAVNQAIELGRAEFVLVMNPDARLEKSALSSKFSKTTRRSER